MEDTRRFHVVDYVAGTDVTYNGKVITSVNTDCGTLTVEVTFKYTRLRCVPCGSYVVRSMGNNVKITCDKVVKKDAPDPGIPIPEVQPPPTKPLPVQGSPVGDIQDEPLPTYSPPEETSYDGQPPELPPYSPPPHLTQVFMSQPTSIPWPSYQGSDGSTFKKGEPQDTKVYVGSWLEWMEYRDKYAADYGVWLDLVPVNPQENQPSLFFGTTRYAQDQAVAGTYVGIFLVKESPIVSGDVVDSVTSSTTVSTPTLVSPTRSGVDSPMLGDLI